jgi:hypothetical protein
MTTADLTRARFAQTVGRVVAEVRSGAASALAMTFREVEHMGPSSPDYGRGWHDGYQQGWASASTVAQLAAAEATGELFSQGAELEPAAGEEVGP